MRDEEDQKKYLYPPLVSPVQMFKGLLLTEWICVVIWPILGLFVFQIIGLMLGLIITATFYILFVRPNNKRMNLFHELCFSFRYLASKKIIKRKCREDLLDEKEE